MAIREIRTIGDEILSKKARPVEKIDGRIQTILGDLADTLHGTGNGVGLAAPQVGVLRRLVVIDLGDGVINLVNPEIIKSEGERVVEEACLSVPGRRGKVKRPVRVTVRFLDETGAAKEIEADELLGKCLCHEIDHLDGILYVDRALEVWNEG